jgi:plastocyanin
VPSPTRSPSPKPGVSGKTYAISEVAVDRFSPSTLSLHRGDSVLVTNNDSTDHTFTIGSLGKDSGNMTQGDTYRLTFSTSGTFTFVCTYHESLGMTGTITVTR